MSALLLGSRDLVGKVIGTLIGTISNICKYTIVTLLTTLLAKSLTPVSTIFLNPDTSALGGVKERGVFGGARSAI